jgi:hypothetical protein
LKVRKQTSKPCEKKGKNNHLPKWSCELRDICKARDFEHSSICMKIEQELIDEGLLRYEIKEVTGLHVLFNGLSSIHNLNCESLSDEENIYYDNEYIEIPLDSYYDSLDSDMVESEEESSTGGSIRDTLVGIRASLSDQIGPKLGHSRNKSSEIFASAPKDLKESMLLKVIREGHFNPDYREISHETKSERIKRELKEDDIYNVAILLLHEIQDPVIMKRLWSRYTPKRFERHKAYVLEVVHKNTPKWARKFDKSIKKLTIAQKEAIDLKHFYEGIEKTTDQESAQSLGIALSSYKDRLKGAYKKLSKLYPEFERARRRKKKKEVNEIPPAPCREIYNKNWYIEAESAEKSFFDSLEEEYSYLRQKNNPKKETLKNSPSLNVW